MSIALVGDWDAASCSVSIRAVEFLDWQAFSCNIISVTEMLAKE